MIDTLDTIASAFAQRGHIVRLRYSYGTEPLYIAVATDEAITVLEASRVALQRSKEALVNPLLGSPTLFGESLGHIIDVQTFVDTHELRESLGLIPSDSVVEIDPEMYDGHGFGQRESTNCGTCGELLMRHEAGRGSTCDACRSDAKVDRRSHRLQEAA